MILDDRRNRPRRRGSERRDMPYRLDLIRELIPANRFYLTMEIYNG